MNGDERFNLADEKRKELKGDETAVALIKAGESMACFSLLLSLRGDPSVFFTFEEPCSDKCDIGEYPELSFLFL